MLTYNWLKLTNLFRQLHPSHWYYFHFDRWMVVSEVVKVRPILSIAYFRILQFPSEAVHYSCRRRWTQQFQLISYHITSDQMTHSDNRLQRSTQRYRYSSIPLSCVHDYLQQMVDYCTSPNSPMSENESSFRPLLQFQYPSN